MKKNKFEQYKNIIHITYFIYNLFPLMLHRLLYDFSRLFEGNISLLLRYYFFKKYSKECGENIFIGRNVTIKSIENLELGNNISIHANSYLDAFGGIKIGSNTSIASNTSIYSSSHTWKESNLPIKYNAVVKQQVVINGNVWVGTGCKILGGVNIAEKNIIGAGSVVNRSTERNALYAGVPAKFIKSL